MSQYSETAGQAGQRVLDAVKRNPEGLLLLAAGCALMLRSRSSGHWWQGANGKGGNGHHREDGFKGSYASGEQGISRTATQAADRAKEFAVQTAGKMDETARSYASSASDYAQDATRQASHYVEQAGRHAAEYGEKFVAEAQSTFQNTVDYLVREQPLAIVAMGLAAGAAVAAVLPPTEMERETLGEVGARVTEAVQERGEGVREAVMKTGERLKEAVEDPTKLQKNLSKVAEDVSEAMSGLKGGESEGGNERPGAQPRKTSGLDPIGRG